MPSLALTPAENKAIAIRRGILAANLGDLDAAVKQLSSALALLTSPDKAQREQAKRLVREWQKTGS